MLDSTNRIIGVSGARESNGGLVSSRWMTMTLDPLLLARLFACAFFAAVFLQSGLDKVTDWKGNLGWLTGHFGTTPLKGMVPLMLGGVTVLELATGVACVGGVAALLLGWGLTLPTAGLALACLALVVLITGQRIAKDYAGAAVLAAYFGVALIGLWIMGG